MTFKKSNIQHNGEMSETFFCLSDLFSNANTCNSLYDKSWIKAIWRKKLKTFYGLIIFNSYIMLTFISDTYNCTVDMNLYK